MLSLSSFYESVFGCKTYKLSLDAGCTCPNRDGTKGFGGCIFCSESGSGDFAANRNLPVKEQVEEAKKLVDAKVKGRSGTRTGKYIAYFQNFTSTYGESEILLQKYNEALECEDVAGLAVATRPDCLSEKILSGLADIARSHFVQIELGLQTSCEATGRLINRCYTNEDYSDAVKRIKKANPDIHIVTHLIFGLPGETERNMLESVKFVVNENPISEFLSSKDMSSISQPLSGLTRQSIFGLKITTLYIVKNTRLAKMYKKGETAPLSREEYFSLLKKSLPLLPENCVIHRLTGDPPKSALIAPSWTTDKKRVMNEIRKLIENRD